MLIVSKFGGSSLADANQIRKVRDIVEADKSRRVIVVSAPGKRDQNDQKVTDLFYYWQQYVARGYSAAEIRLAIKSRFTDIVRELGLTVDIDAELAKIADRIKEGASAAYAASRGEYLSGKIIAELLGYTFLDPAEFLRFASDGQCKRDDVTIREVIGDRHVVVPGFYGSSENDMDEIHTFSRGGSDLTGAILARAMRADRYENWTDVPGLLMADPRIVKSPKGVQVISYREVRELAYMGASVFHEEAMFPVQEAGIPTNICDTNHPADHGTLLVPNDDPRQQPGPVVGIAGRAGFVAITIEKMLMDREVGFGLRVLSVLTDAGVSFEHMPGGVDHLTVIIDRRRLGGKLDFILRRIKEVCNPDRLSVTAIALVVVVGRGMVRRPGVLAKVASAINQAGINIETVNQGLSEISIVIGVAERDLDVAVRAIYAACVG